MKLTVIGGGGVRSMFLAKSIAMRASELNIDKLVFMDNNEQKLNIYGNMAKKVANILCPNLDFEITTDAAYAVTDADYVIPPFARVAMICVSETSELHFHTAF